MKKYLALILAAVLTITAVVGGTIAYLQDTDDSVDVMTSGNVRIDQLELQRKPTAAANEDLIFENLDPFKQGLELAPAYASSDDAYAVGANGLWNKEKLVGSIDKLIYVKNTGSRPAFFRTWIAIECPEGVSFGYNLSDTSVDILANVNTTDYTWETVSAKQVIDGQSFVILCGTAKVALEAGQISAPSLRQVVMTHNADSDVSEAIGKNYEILAFSQAVQVSNLDHLGAAGALVEAFKNDMPWESEGVIDVAAAKTVEDLEEALTNGKTVFLADDIVIKDTINVAPGAVATLDLNGYTITASITGNPAINNEGTLTIQGTGTVKNAISNAVKNQGTLVINGGTYESSSTYALNNDSGKMTVNNVSAGAIYNIAELIVNNSTIKNTVSGKHGIYHSGSSLIINGGEFENTSNNELIKVNTNNAVLNGGTYKMTGKSYILGGNIVVNDGTFYGYVNSNGSVDPIRPNSGVIVKSGTFNFNPSTCSTLQDAIVKDNKDGTYTVYPVNDTWDGTEDISWYPTVATAAETATAATYELYTAEQLAGLAQLVNDYGVTFKGDTVKLMVNADLKNSEWEPIGRIGITSTDFDFSFKGTFDGQNKTVKNLKVNNEGWAGLFGIAYKATITNVKIDGVTLNSNRQTGSVVGQLYGSLENCHVSNVNITVVPNWTGTAYDNGDKVGGIVGWIGDNNNNHYLKGCSATNVKIKAYRDLGGLAGYVAWSTTVSGNAVSAIDLTVDQTTGFYGEKEANAGALWGRNSVSDSGVGVIASNNKINGLEVVAPSEGETVVEAVNKAFEEASNGDTITLPNGNFVVPSSAQGKTLKLVGTGNTTVAVTQVGSGGENCDYGFDGSTVEFNNITITTNGSTYIGYARLNAVYNNCTINNTYTLYGDSVFNNCTFNVSGDSYNIWTWGAPNVTFNNCTFNTSGKALLLYGTANTNLTVNNCTFNDDNAYATVKDKAAIEIGNDYNKSYTLTVTNTTVNGFDVNPNGIVTGTTLYANKNSMPADKLKVTIDGVDYSNVANWTFIDSAEELFAFANDVNVNGNDYSGKKVLLTADIDLENALWTPIGQTGATQFKGIFDGQGYTIKNLNIDSSAQTGKHYSSGLFGWAESNVTIKNVNVDGATVIGNHNVAVIVGYTYSGKISGCNVSNANIVCNHANDDACGDKCGLIAGYAGDESRISNCTAADSTVKAGRDGGQLIGAGYNVSVSGCSATNVTVSATAGCTDSNAGGNLNNAVIGRVLD